MPTYYKRQPTSTRGSWSLEDLNNAMQAVRNGSSINAAAQNYGVPRKTLERRLKNNNSSKGRMGPDCVLGEQVELKLVSHLMKMQKSGFPMTIDDVRRVAFFFAEQLKISHKFNRETERAGYDWFNSFLRRHPDLSLRKAEGVSVARSQGMNRTEVENYFKLLQETLEEHELLNKPGCIYNTDETGLQINNRTGVVVAKKGSKTVSMTTSSEKGETISCITCCNAEGTFLPPACIFKGKYKKAEYEDGLPPGSVIYMAEKSAYVNTTIFTTWLKEHFIPRKPAGKVLLILDSHASHSSSVELLEVARDNDVVLLCLPSHTTHYLQPLDRAVFKSLKSYFYGACQQWVRANPGRKLTRLQFGQLLSESWGKSCTVSNAISAFKATGIFPFNPQAVPDYAFSEAFSISDSITEDPSASKQGSADSQLENQLEGLHKQILSELQVPIPTIPEVQKPGSSQPSTTKENSSPQASTSTNEDITPGTLLQQISPVPRIVTKIKKATKNLGVVLTSEENINQLHEKKSQKRKLIPKVPSQKKKSRKPVKKSRRTSSELSSDPDEIDLVLESDDNEDEFDEDVCVGCSENYYQTKRKEDWIKCVKCLHEDCTSCSGGYMKTVQAFQICA